MRFQTFLRMSSCIALFVLALGLSPCLAGTTELISVWLEDSTESPNTCVKPGISADGRFVAFSSFSARLVAGDATNDIWDVFVRDRMLNQTELISVSSTGEQGNGHSGNARNRPEDGSIAISGDGRFVVFESAASNLIPDDTNGMVDIFVRDRLLNITKRVSVSSGGEQANDFSQWPAISADGRLIAFHSVASNLVPNDTNGAQDVFLYDQLLDTTTRVSVGDNGEEGSGDSWGPSISADGRFIAFSSYAWNWASPPESIMVSRIFVRDLITGITELVSVGVNGEVPNGASLAPSINANGRFIAFLSRASNLVDPPIIGRGDVYVRDRLTNTTKCVSVDNEGIPGNNESSWPSISGNGRFVAFQSYATLTPNDINFNHTDIFVRDRLLGTTEMVSVNSAGEQVSPNASSDSPSINDDGRYVAFRSTDLLAPGRIAQDTSTFDIYLRDRGPFQIFFDIPLESWAASEIGACYRAGIIMGYPDGSYRPDLEVTRDQMAVFISRAIAGGDAGIPERFWGGSSFLDVPLDYWAYRYIEFAHRQHVVEGVTSNLYEPTLPVDRAQMAVFIARALVAPRGDAGLSDYHPPTNPTFPDVPGNFWAYKYIEYIADPARAVTQGYPDGFYHPDAICTRDQMAVFIARAFKLE